MVGPCWTSPLPRIRWEPDAVMPAPQLDLFQQLQPVALPPAAPGHPTPETSVDGPSVVPPAEIRMPAGAIAADDVLVDTGRVRVWYVPHDRARRYRLMLRADGTARCTVPRRGSLRDARRFVDGARDWLCQQWRRRAAQPKADRHWVSGSKIWFRGNPVPLELEYAPDGRPTHVRIDQLKLLIRAAGTAGPATPPTPETDVRPAVERALRRLAERELPPRVQALAAAAGISLTRVTVRNQRTRWGSCSRHGVISLNWRLIQTPEFVCDYIILHELAHRRHLNHSTRFWDEVARLCPGWENAEAWIKQHGRELL